MQFYKKLILIVLLLSSSIELSVYAQSFGDTDIVFSGEASMPPQAPAATPGHASIISNSLVGAPFPTTVPLSPAAAAAQAYFTPATIAAIGTSLAAAILTIFSSNKASSQN